MQKARIKLVSIDINKINETDSSVYEHRVVINPYQEQNQAGIEEVDFKIANVFKYFVSLINLC